MNQVINHLVLLFEMEYFSFWAMQVCLLATYNDSLGGAGLFQCVSVTPVQITSNSKKRRWGKKSGKNGKSLLGVMVLCLIAEHSSFFWQKCLSPVFLLYFTYCTRKKKDWNCGMTADRHIIITTPTNYHFKFKVSETFQRNWVGFLLGFFWLFLSVWCAHNFTYNKDRATPRSEARLLSTGSGLVWLHHYVKLELCGPQRRKE